MNFSKLASPRRWVAVVIMGLATAAAGQDPSGNRVVRALGRLEPASGVINVAGVAGARVLKILVKEGDAVDANAPLAILEGHEERTVETAIATAQYREAEARLNAELANEKTLRDQWDIQRRRVEELEPQDIKAQEAALAPLAETVKVLGDSLDRLKSLQTTAIPREQIDRQQAQLNQTKREYELAKRGLERLKANHELNRRELAIEAIKITQAAERARASIPLKSLLEQKKLAEVRLANTTVRAPIKGRILKINVKAGEVAASGAILQLGNTGAMVAIAEIYETDVLGVAKGQSASVRMLGDSIKGTVESVGLMVARNYLLSVDPTAKSDARVIEARIALEPSDAASRLTNLQVDVEIVVPPKATAAR